MYVRLAKIVDEATPQPMIGRRGVGAALRRVAAVTALAVLTLPVAPAQARDLPSFADLVEKLTPGVVNISTSQTQRRSDPGRGGEGAEIPRFPPGSPFEEFFKEFFERQRGGDAPSSRKVTSLGSGFVIDPSGLIVTNNHVIADADEITVIFQDDSSLKATVVGRDQKTDLAVLRVTTPKPLAAVPWGNSDESRVGDWVLAIGNPFGLGGTVTAGIVSARKRNINAGPYDDFLQTDAPINRGNSGGPMFNLKGEVIGINTAIFSPTGASVGIGFAIPSNLAKPIVDQLRDFGRARRGWLGVRIQTVTDELAQSLGLEKATGALIAGISESGPAETAKLQVGDVVITFDGKPIEDMRRLPRVVAETAVGRQVEVEVWRKAKKTALSVTLGEFPDDEKVAAVRPDGDGGAKTDGQATLGLSLALVSRDLRQKYNLGEDVKGVVVTKVDEDSPASEKRIRAGDIIRKIGPDQEVATTPNQVRAKIEQARKAKLRSILVLVETEGNQRFVALRIDKS